LEGLLRHHLPRLLLLLKHLLLPNGCDVWVIVELLKLLMLEHLLLCGVQVLQPSMAVVICTRRQGVH
jgi:hypothetical protein